MKIELFSAAFWGVLLILIGILLIIKYVFNIHFPIARVVIALLFIYIGIRMLIGYHGIGFSFKGSESSAAFSDTKFTYSPYQNKYSCAFGSATLDLSDIKITENKSIEVSAVFSEIKITINKDSNLEIHSNTAFGNSSTPDGSNNAFGETTYRTPNFNPDLPYLYIKTNVAFGAIKIITNQ